jgi:hypothetical protein
LPVAGESYVDFTKKEKRTKGSRICQTTSYKSQYPQFRFDTQKKYVNIKAEKNGKMEEKNEF